MSRYVVNPDGTFNLHTSPKEKTRIAMENRIRIMKLLEIHPEGLTVDRIAESTGLSESVVKRALNTMLYYDGVEKVYRKRDENASM